MESNIKLTKIFLINNFFLVYSRSVPQSRYKNLQQRIQSQQEEIYKLETSTKKSSVNKNNLMFFILALQDYRAKLDVLREDNENLLKRVNNNQRKKIILK